MRKYILLIIFILVFALASCRKKTDPLTATLNSSLDTISVGDSWSDQGCSSNGDSCTKVEGTVDTSLIGEYRIYYKAENEDEIIYLMRVVTVIDDIYPVIVLNAGVDTIFVGESWVDTGCSATDNYDSSITCSINSNSVDANTAGEYIVVYETTDSSGNLTLMSRYVFVIEE